nr:ArgE/DapE family deacylase [Lactococcus garvieae]
MTLDAIKILQDVVQINSVNGNEEEVAKYLRELLQEHDIESKIIPYSEGRASLVAEIGNGNGPVIGFDGHEDTVSLGDESKWTHHPLSATVTEEGKMYGRGTTDMKSGLVAAVVAMINLKESGLPLNGTVRLLATVGEEKGELGAGQLAELGYADDMEALVVCEPTGGDFTTLQQMKGTFPLDIPEFDGEMRLIFIGHKGSVNYKVHAKGKAAHSSMPELGKNAIEGLLKFYDKQKVYFDKLTEEDDLLGPTIPVVTLINGGEQINTVPANASMGVKIRTIPALPNEKLISDIQALIDECNREQDVELSLEVTEVTENVAPVKSSPDSKIVKVTSEVLEEHLQQKAPQVGVSGGTDASQFVRANPNLDIVVCGPGNATAHAVDEYVLVDSFLDFIKIYEDMIQKYFAS